MSGAGAVGKCDDWRWWPSAGMGILTAIFAYGHEMPGGLSFLLILLTILAGAVAAVALAGRACLAFWRRQPRCALSACVALLAPALLLFPLMLAAQYVHLAMTLGLGLGYVGPAPQRGAPVEIYDWSAGLAGGANSFLIHDTSDSLAASGVTGDAADWGNADLLKECAGRSQHLIGHY